MDKKSDKNYKTVTDIMAECLGNLAKARTGCRHIQKSGMALYDDGDKFLFTPDQPAKGEILPFRAAGIAQQLRDGTFDFVRKPRLRAESELILKLAHGRVSKTKDGAVQLTLKVYQDEGINIPQAIAREALEACKAVREWQMKR